MSFYKLRIARIGTVIGSLIIVLGLNGSSVSFGNGISSSGDADAGGGTFSASVVVPPWCGWTQSSISDFTLSGDGSLYTGLEYDLTGSSGTLYAYVNGGSTITSVAPSDNCSYYGTAPYSAALNMAIDGVGFSGVSDADPSSIPDTGFSWDGSLSFTNNFTPGTCLNYNTHPGATLNTPGSIDIWDVSTDDTTTNNFCSYSISYNSKIPSGLNPTFGDSNYTVTGPTLTVTLTTS